MSTSDICASSNMLFHSKCIKLYAYEYLTHNLATIIIIVMTNIAMISILMNLVLHLVHTKQINPHDLLFSWVSTAFGDNVDDDVIGAGDVDAGDDDAIGDIDCGDYGYGGGNDYED